MLENVCCLQKKCSGTLDKRTHLQREPRLRALLPLHSLGTMVLNWHNDRSGCMYTSSTLEGEPTPRARGPRQPWLRQTLPTPRAQTLLERRMSDALPPPQHSAAGCGCGCRVVNTLTSPTPHPNVHPPSCLPQPTTGRSASRGPPAPTSGCASLAARTISRRPRWLHALPSRALAHTPSLSLMAAPSLSLCLY
jgi:hypothetical protein